jgi:hypothetical protein
MGGFGSRLVSAIAASAILGGLVVTQATPASAATPVTAGYKDFSYLGTGAPTAEKPQSKLWFYDGVWWGVLFRPTTGGGNFYINKFDWATHTWTDTHVPVDTRSDVRLDALSDNGKLYVAASSASANPARPRGVQVWRYTYDQLSKTYTADAGFPVALDADGQIMSITIDKDSTGKLWATYVFNGKVMVTHTTTSDTSWVPSYELPVGTAADVRPEPDGDASSLVHFGGNRIGVMWSNQNVADLNTQPTHLYWAVHVDGTDDSAGSWAFGPPVASGIRIADDHINLKALDNDPAGLVFAAVKTSLTGTQPLIRLHRLQPNGTTWTTHVFATAAANHTRPIVQLDPEHRKLYMFAASPCCNGGAIYYKEADLDNLPAVFSGPDLGTPFIKSATETNINNPSGTKQTLSGLSGLLVIAADDPSDFYFHNTLDLKPPPVGGAYRPLTPARILDTREGLGAPKAKIPAVGSISVQVAGQGGVPASGATAVVLNTTATNTTASGFFTVYPSLTTRPLASNLNFLAGESVPNLVEVPLGTDGKVTVYNGSGGSTDAVLDVAGWVTTPQAATDGNGLYQALTPARLLDTRNGSGTPLGPDSTLTLQVNGQGGVPATGVSGVVLNVTVTGTTASSYLTVHPSTVARPVVSNLNFVPGQTVANRVMVPVGADGKIKIYNHLGSAHVIVDVNGWFRDGGAALGARFKALAPTRILDSRPASKVGPYGTPFPQNTTRTVTVAGVGGVPAMNAPIPPTAVVLNVTVTNPTASSYLTAFPSDAVSVPASDLNWKPGLTVANLVVVKLGPDGMVKLYNQLGSTDVVVDVLGWYG